MDFWQLLHEIQSKYATLVPVLAQPGVFAAIADALQNHAGDAAYLENALRQTPYYQQTPESQRKWDVQRVLDPATARQKLEQYTRWVADAMHQTGVDLAIGQGWDYFNSPFFKFLNRAISEGWDQQRIKYQMVSAGLGHGGEIGDNQAKVLKMADDYGLPMSREKAYGYGMSLTAGMTDINAVQGDMIDQALSLYPGLAQQIQQGFTVRQIADPYLQIAQQELGVDPTTVLLTDPKWNRAINSVDTTTGKRIPMSLADWTRTVRTDKEYGYDKTLQAQTRAAQLNTQIRQMMGAQG